MNRFAHYCLRYDYDNNDMFAQLDWTKRQTHFGSLFTANDSIDFLTHREGKEIRHNHNVYHLSINPNIIVVRIANYKELLIEQDFKHRKIINEPSCYIIIDNRQDCRRVLIEKLASSFSSTDQVAKIVQRNICDKLLAEHHFSIELNAQRYPKDFYKAWRLLEQKTASLAFDVPPMDNDEATILIDQLKPGSSQFDDFSISGEIIQIAVKQKKARLRTKMNFSPQERKTLMTVEQNSDYIRNVVDFCALTGSPIEIITTDNQVFTCYVNSELESDDRIVASEFDSENLDILFDQVKKDGQPVKPEEREKAEQEVLKYVNDAKSVESDNPEKSV